MDEIKKQQFNKMSILKQIIPVIAVIGIVLLVFTMYVVRNRQEVLKRNEDYIRDLTLSLADRIESNFTSSETVVKGIANLYGDKLLDHDNIQAMLVEIELNSQFDHVRFVGTDGILHSSNGKSDNVINKEYFLKGMRGQTGVIDMLNSNFVQHKMIGFYTPLYIDDSIAGVLTAYYDESNYRQLLDYSIYGEKAIAGIINNEGKMLINSPSAAVEELYEKGAPEDVCDLINTDYIDETSKAIIVYSYVNQQATGFRCSGVNGKTIGYMTPIEGSKLSVYMIFPSAVTNNLNLSSEKSGRELLLVLLLIFILYVLGMILSNYIHNKKEAEKNRMANYISLAENAVSSRLIFLDLEKDEYEDLSRERFMIDKNGSIEYLKGGFIESSEGDDVKNDIKYFFDVEIGNRKKLDYFPNVILMRGLKYGPEFYYSMTFVAVEVENDVVNKGVLLFRNVTEEKKKEKRVRQQLENANNAKTDFLFNMSHDIRTPMNAIIGFTHLLEKYQESPEKRAYYLEKIEDSSIVLLSIINNVLEMARIEKGTLELDEVVWNVEDFNNSLYSVFDEMMKQKEITFVKNVNVQHESVYCDAIKVREVFLNILSNAYKYTEKGGRVSLELEEIPYNKEGYVLFKTTISDTGIGMSPEFVETIFDEFSREYNTTENKIEGTGLGMAIVKRLVDFLDGTIEVESEKNVGTTFTIQIPHRIVEEEKLVKKQKAELDTRDFHGKRILLAEDNDLNAEIAMEILSASGLIVERAENGKICVDMLEKAADDYYDLILMDIQMPVMTGFEATIAIRNMENDKKAKIPILAMTANAFEEDKKAAIKCGMNGHLAKPINVPLLFRELGLLLSD